jgi:hypothetical protein
MALAMGVGSEVQCPLATVVLKRIQLVVGGGHDVDPGIMPSAKFGPTTKEAHHTDSDRKPRLLMHHPFPSGDVLAHTRTSEKCGLNRSSQNRSFAPSSTTREPGSELLLPNVGLFITATGVPKFR